MRFLSIEDAALLDGRQAEQGDTSVMDASIALYCDALRLRQDSESGLAAANFYSKEAA